MSFKPLCELSHIDSDMVYWPSMGIFTPGLFGVIVLEPGAFSPLVRFKHIQYEYTTITIGSSSPERCGLGSVENSVVVQLW